MRVRRKRHVSLSAWRAMVGRLSHVAPVFPGSCLLMPALHAVTARAIHKGAARVSVTPVSLRDLRLWRARLATADDGSVPLLMYDAVPVHVAATDAGARACASHTHNKCAWRRHTKAEVALSSTHRELIGVRTVLTQLLPDVSNCLVIIGVDNAATAGYMNDRSPAGDSPAARQAMAVLRDVAAIKVARCIEVIGLQVPRARMRLADAMADCLTADDATRLFRASIAEHGSAAEASLRVERLPVS